VFLKYSRFSGLLKVFFIIWNDGQWEFLQNEPTCSIAARNTQNNALSFHESPAFLCNSCETLAQYRQRIDTIHSSRRSYGDMLARCDLSRIERRPKFYRSNSHDANCIAPARLVYAKLLSSRLFSAHSVHDVKRNHSGHLGIISEVYSWAAVHFH